MCAGTPRWRPRLGEGQASGPCQSEVFSSKVSFTLSIYINGHRGRERQEEVGPRLSLTGRGTEWVK